jgi:hypothetical protein
VKVEEKQFKKSKRKLWKKINVKRQKIYSNNCKIYQSYFFHHKSRLHNNPSCLKQFNNFIKKFNFEFGHCCICNENKFTNELIICDISNLDPKLKLMKNLLKMNPKFHFEYDIKFVPKELLNDTKHMHLELEGLLLSNQGI